MPDLCSSLNLKTFSDTRKIIRVKAKEKIVILRADRGLFAQMALVAQNRQLDMKTVLSYPLGPLPWSLAAPDGTPHKTSKSSLMNVLTKNAINLENHDIPYHAYLIDGMSLVQKMSESIRTFGEVSERWFHRVLKDSGNAKRIDVVFDVYLNVSINNAERTRRGQGTANMRIEHITTGHSIRSWRNFLTESCNKSALITFIFEQWCKFEYRKQLGGKYLLLTCGSKCYKYCQ